MSVSPPVTGLRRLTATTISESGALGNSIARRIGGTPNQPAARGVALIEVAV